jgi:hypothetical protein
VIAVSASNSSQSFEITLDDTDGSIKAIFNGADIHKRDARVYQYFDGLSLSVKFLLFSGKISSPIIWSERDRTVKFTIISQLEDREVGFSAEEGQFPYLPADMVGKPWPMILGTVRDCPALQVNHAVTGTTLDGIGILAGLDEHDAVPLYSNGLNTDSGLGISLAQISAQISTLWCGKYCWDSVDDGRAGMIQSQINDLYSQRAQAVGSSQQQAQCATTARQTQVTEARNQGLGANPCHILGGEDFPQGTTLTLEINGGLFMGYFAGNLFYIQSRSWPDGEEQAANEAGEMEKSRYYWPSTLRVDQTWPAQVDIASGDAGGGGIGQGATGELPIGYIDGIESGGIVWVGGPNVILEPHSDYGDRMPTDTPVMPARGWQTASYRIDRCLRVQLLRSGLDGGRTTPDRRIMRRVCHLQLLATGPSSLSNLRRSLTLHCLQVCSRLIVRSLGVARHRIEVLLVPVLFNRDFTAPIGIGDRHPETAIDRLVNDAPQLLRLPHGY